MLTMTTKIIKMNISKIDDENTEKFKNNINNVKHCDDENGKIKMNINIHDFFDESVKKSIVEKQKSYNGSKSGKIKKKVIRINNN